MSNIRTYEITHCEQKLFPIQQKDSTDYFIDGSLVMKNGKIDKFLFDGGYAQASAVSNTTKDKFAFYYYNQDHLGNNREEVDASGQVTCEMTSKNESFTCRGRTNSPYGTNGDVLLVDNPRVQK